MRSLSKKPSGTDTSASSAVSRRPRIAEVQKKLKKNVPGDTYEVEADRAAEQVVKRSSTASVSGSSSFGAIQQKPLSNTLTPFVQLMEEEDVQTKEDENVQLEEPEQSTAGMPDPREAEDPIREESIQAKEEEDAQLKEEESVQAENEESEVQLKEEGLQTEELVESKTDIGATTDQLQQTKGGGTNMTSETLTEMNDGFGADFSGVKIHTGAPAEEMSNSLGAQAFTHQNDIYFNTNKYNPSTTTGKFLLAHELAHTVQQGAAPVKQPKQEEELGNVPPEKNISSVPAQEKETSEPVKSAPVEAEAITPEETEASVPSTVTKEQFGVVSSDDMDEEDVSESESESEEQQSPENDPEFQQTLKYIGQTAKEESQHPNPDKKVNQVKQAAVLPASRQERANDEAGHIVGMEETAKKRKPFEAANFKELLKKNLTDLEKQLPKDKDSADEFKEQKPIDKVKQNIGNQVEAENNKIAGPLASQANADQPPKSGLPVEHEKPISEDKPGKAPQPFNPKNALPKKKKDTDISMEKESASMDEFMAKNHMSDEQLAKSEEPKFIETLDSKKAAQQKAEEVPQEYRKKEAAQMNSAEQQVGKESKKAFNGMHKDRSGAFSKVFGSQKSTEKTDEEKKAEMNDRFNAIYNQTQGYVTTKLEWLSAKVTSVLEHDAGKAKRIFEKNVEEGLDDIYGWTTLDDKLFGEDTGAINRLFKKEKATFISAMDAAIDKISEIIANTLNAALADIERGRQKAKDYFEGLDKSWQKLGKESYDLFSERYDALEDSVYDTENELAQSLAQIYKDNVDSLEETFNELKEAASTGWLDGAWNMLKNIAETIQKLIDMVTNLLSAITSALSVIIEDPIGFMKKLFDGIGKGIDAFKANIQQHLMGGFIQWLTGSLGPMGIAIPDDIFSLKGIFSLVMQVLGLGWGYIREKAVKMMGEPVVKALESGYDMFKTFATKGLEGIWEFLKDSFTDLKETVIGAIKDMLITQVIQAGIKWLLSLLIPGAGFIKAIMAIKDLIVFFVESAIMLIPAITEAIIALAAGSVAGVAIAIERGLASLIALVINLFAKLIGLGGLSKKVMAIFSKIRKRVDKVVMRLLNKAKKAGRKLLGKLGIGKEKAGGKEERSKKEMEVDLNMGIKEGTKYVKSAEGKGKKEIDKGLTQIAGKFDLKKLELVIDKYDENGKEQVHVHGEVNPKGNSDIFKVDLDGDDGESITRPPEGRAYLVKQSASGRRHFVAFFPNGNLYHLGYDERKKVKKGSKILAEIFVTPSSKEVIPADGAVSVPAPGSTVEKFTEKIEAKINDKLNKYRGQGYVATENDCLVFTLEILNSVFNSGIRVPKKPVAGKKPKPGEDYNTWYDGFKKKE